MTLAQLNETLLGTGMPVAYEAFKTDQSLPCITYNVTYSDNFSADGIVYQKILHVDIFLFTATKDLVKEAALETALTNAGLFYNTTETYLEDEKAFQILYEVEI